MRFVCLKKARPYPGNCRGAREIFQTKKGTYRVSSHNDPALDKSLTHPARYKYPPPNWGGHNTLGKTIPISQRAYRQRFHGELSIKIERESIIFSRVLTQVGKIPVADCKKNTDLRRWGPSPSRLRKRNPTRASQHGLVRTPVHFDAHQRALTRSATPNSLLCPTSKQKAANHKDSRTSAKRICCPNSCPRNVMAVNAALLRNAMNYSGLQDKEKARETQVSRTSAGRNAPHWEAPHGPPGGHFRAEEASPENIIWD